MNAPTISVPSISSSAVLVALSIGAWTGMKKDKAASDQVATANGAAVGVANVNKKLLGDCPDLIAINKFVGNTRNTHYAMTLPWSDLGLRICTTQRYIGQNGYTEVMTGLQQEFYRLVDTFLASYEWEITQAQLKLGNLFNPLEYPTVENLRKRFRFSFSAMPLPEAGDFRLDINTEAQDILRTEYAKFYEAEYQGAIKEVWNRAYKAVEAMSERLALTDDGDKKTFRDSLVENMNEAIDLLGDMNLTNDPTMADAHARLKHVMRGVTAEGLRRDELLRTDTKKSVDEVKRIIDNLPGMGF